MDQARHTEKIREAIKQNLPQIISEEAIITSDGNHVIKVPIRTLEEFHFRFDPYSGERVGQGDGDTQVGDVIGRLPGKDKGGGKAGDQPGIDYYEVEISIDELAELIFEDLGLPNLRPAGEAEIPADQVKFTEVRKQGAMNNLDKRRTVLENILRNARHGQPKFGGLTRDDLRFKTWTQDTRKTTSAVVIAMRDASGSMGDFKKYITRSLFFWMVRFLRTRYQDVEIVFITHDSDAKEVGEEEFFTRGESGGTRVSTAYQLAYNIVQERYDPKRWNIYPFHFSDGDNWSEADNQLCVQLVHRLLAVSNLFGYGEIREGNYTSSLMSAFGQIQDPRFVVVTVSEKADVYPALQKWFAQGSLAPR